MEYEIVHLDKKIVVGVGAYTSNDDPNMGQVIGDLWKKFFQEGICNTIQNRTNEYAIGLYSDYTEQNYHVLTGVEVSELDNSDLVSRVIPAGTYAKFRIHCNNSKQILFHYNPKIIGCDNASILPSLKT